MAETKASTIHCGKLPRAPFPLTTIRGRLANWRYPAKRTRQAPGRNARPRFVSESPAGACGILGNGQWLLGSVRVANASWPAWHGGEAFGSYPRL